MLSTFRFTLTTATFHDLSPTRGCLTNNIDPIPVVLANIIHGRSPLAGRTGTNIFTHARSV